MSKIARTPVMGKDFINHVCAIYGINPDKVQAITIMAIPDEPLSVNIELYGDRRLLDTHSDKSSEITINTLAGADGARFIKTLQETDRGFEE